MILSVPNTLPIIHMIYILNLYNQHFTISIVSQLCFMPHAADVAVAKRNQQLDKIWLTFYPHFIYESSLLIFQKDYVVQYTPLTLDAVQFAQHTLGHLP